MLGERVMPEPLKLLDGPAVPYGKGALAASTARWNTAVRAFTRCSGGQCGPRSAAGRRSLTAVDMRLDPGQPPPLPQL